MDSGRKLYIKAVNKGYKGTEKEFFELLRLLISYLTVTINGNSLVGTGDITVSTNSYTPAGW